ncbi:glycosylinositol phosphorylceramide mannosyl transferase 1 isoform X1 [Magnolia sinica]|uniref:glycosylinositol phosphorylceramide mannosyl transferase 1 isoform X1 n=1 Tax=Magnolia sinica TaxID=86752 RepID=UPI002657D546|nr:glycosylinositol phosphorylceramide mannosyl transferase 1 isoform X1 [Magnolia sinica]
MRGSPSSRRLLQRFRQLTISAIGSVKIKLLLACCIAFTLVVITGRAAAFMGWRHHVTVGSSPPRKGYTILINTWKRNDLLKKSISHYTSCPGVDAIRIVWSEPNPPSDSLRGFLWKTLKSNSKDGKEIELRFDINKEDSLNNRFKEIKDLKTDAVFSIDDDVVFPCSSVEFAFSVWQSAPATMVGFVPRMHWVDKTKGSAEYYSYGGWWSVWWMGRYSMVLSKAAFFHKKYLDMYTNQMPASIRDYITKNRNCEDIAMAFLVANATDAPPIWVKGKIFEIGSTGISSLGGHSDRRSQCVNWFAAEFGRMPLVSTSVKAIDSRHIWLW